MKNFRCSLAFVFSILVTFPTLAAFPILQGATTDSTTEIVVLRKKTDALTYKLKAAEAEVTDFEIDVSQREDSEFVTDRLYFSGLSLQPYVFEILSAGKVVDTRNLKLLSPFELSYRVVVATCMKDNDSKRFKIWDHVKAANADLIVFGGDAVYADSGAGKADPKKLWRRYGETRERLPVFYWTDLVPIIATWDDHDYGENNEGAGYKYKNEVTEIFRAYFGQRNENQFLQLGPGVSSRFELGFLNFMMFDNRSFRKEGDQWGSDQKNWIANHSNDPGKLHLFFNGSQYYGGYHSGESVEREDPAGMEWLVNHISNSKLPSYLISGDKHYSEVMEIHHEKLSAPLIEVSSSAIHSTKPLSLKNNPRRIKGVRDNNFIIMDMEKLETQYSLSYIAMGIKGQVFFEGNDRRDRTIFSVSDVFSKENPLKKVKSALNGKGPVKVGAN
jgi:alkaline phosphatase D